jgi:hypothetical protein
VPLPAVRLVEVLSAFGASVYGLRAINSSSVTASNLTIVTPAAKRRCPVPDWSRRRGDRSRKFDCSRRLFFPQFPMFAGSSTRLWV